MKQPYLKKLSARLCIILVLAGAVFIIHSCRKDIRLIPMSAADSVAQAKAWYEGAYPSSAGRAYSSNLVTQSTTMPGSSKINYSQYVKPDWGHTASYKRFNKSVIEMPMDASNSMAAALKNKNTGQIIYNKENSKSSFVLLYDGENYTAYIMTIVADAAYIGNDPAKLAKNTYRKRDANFSGMVFYFTPQGQFAGSFQYKNGRQVTSTTLAASALAQRTLSITSPSKRVAVAQQPQSCIDWYWDVWLNNYLISETYLYTTCTDEGGDSGGGGSTPNPNPCGVVVSVAAPAHSRVFVAQPPPDDGGDNGDDPGFPAPVPVTCPQQNPDPQPPNIVDNVKNPCLHSMVEATINANITTVVNGLMQNVFGGSGQVNLTYSDGMVLAAGQEGYTPPVLADINGNFNEVVNLNANELPNYSQEFIATVIMHESLHAYLTTIGSLDSYQHIAIMTVFVTQMAADLQQMFPNLSDVDSKNLALGGLDSTPAFKDQIASNMTLLGSYNSTQLAYSAGPSGTRCH